MVSGKFALSDMSGPIGITQTMTKTISKSFSQYLYLVVIISINLGVVNLLPLPILDGGQILLLLIEAITRKPIPPEKRGMINLICALLMITLFVFITFNDISKLFGF